MPHQEGQQNTRRFSLIEPRPDTMNGLSKSRILNHRQCPRRLWLQVNRPELAKTDAGMQARFDVGNQVGELARTFYPEGVLIDEPTLSKALEQTQSVLLGTPRPIFEATFQTDGVLVRADLLLPDVGGYRMVEVKSSTEVKPYHLDDAAIQAWVARQTGVSLTRVEVACIDKTFVYKGDGSYSGLLKHVDVTDTTRSYEQHIPGWVQAAKQTLTGGEPSIDVGEQCHSPYGCPFLNACSPQALNVPDSYPVDILPWAGKLMTELRAEGYEDVRDIPPGRLKSATHERIRRACISGRAEISPGILAEIRHLSYPRYYIDFETIGLAVPIWTNARPYQPIPFQWSCHEEKRGGAIEHKEFLATGTDDPRRAFAESLIAALGVSGPIFVYNAGTESSHMRHLALRFPDLAPALNAAIKRIFDLLPVAREHYYHPAMMGSWSIKDVLPTIAPELTYDNLEVSSGTHAMQVYAEQLNPSLSPEQRGILREALLRYCERDTLALVKLVHSFKKMVLI
jgi:hypothetical protein